MRAPSFLLAPVLAGACATYGPRAAYAQYPNALAFSHAEGAYGAPFQLGVAGLTADTVRYTTDGSVPGPADAYYDGALAVASPPPDAPDVFALVPTTRPQDRLPHFKAWAPPRSPLHKARVLRLASFRDGARTSPVYTRTYFTDGSLADRYATPVISLVFDSAALFDFDTGIHVTGVHYRESSPSYSGNAMQRGRTWERRAHFAYFEAGAERAAVSQGAGVRIHGGSSRSAAQKSLRLYARDDYSEDGHGRANFRHAFFPALDNDRYGRLLLRTTMSDFEGPAMIKDAVAHELIGGLGLESQRSRPAAVYLNGEYWGIYTLTERMDERYVAYRTGADRNDVEIADLRELGDAGSEDFAPVSFARDHDLSQSDAYAAFAELVDLDNLITYFCVEQFLGNYDWPVNNHKYWRERGGGGRTDGRWRALAYDFDWAFKDAAHDMFAHMMVAPDYDGWPADGYSTAMFRGLIRNADFRARYAARFEELLATAFSTDSTLAGLARVRARYRPQVAAHANRWDYPADSTAWEAVVDAQVRDFLARRPAIARRQLRAFFDGISSAADSGHGGRSVLRAWPVPEGVVLGNFGNQPVLCTRVAVLDVTGRPLAVVRDVTVAAGGQVRLSVPGLPAGAYAAAAETSEGAVVRRMVLVP